MCIRILYSIAGWYPPKPRRNRNHYANTRHADATIGSGRCCRKTRRGEAMRIFPRVRQYEEMMMTHIYARVRPSAGRATFVVEGRSVKVCVIKGTRARKQSERDRPLRVRFAPAHFLLIFSGDCRRGGRAGVCQYAHCYAVNWILTQCQPAYTCHKHWRNRRRRRRRRRRRGCSIPVV